jgi:magnesium chelatase subunit D
MGELLLEAALASLPPDVLAQLAQSSKTQIKGGGQSRSGALRQSRSRGSPLPPRPGLPRQGARLHVLATLGHAAPRQKLRAPLPSSPGAASRLAIRAEDFHIHRFAERTQTCLIFAIDASGSAALHRLAEAKGAVELLLAQSYARRDQVCVVGFRGSQAEVLLPPTKSLVRAKRSLAGLPGGGGTPLPHAMKLALDLALPTIRLEKDYLTTIVAVLGTTISPYLFFWQASEDAEDIRLFTHRTDLLDAPEQGPGALERIELDTLFGMGFSNLVALAIIVTTAATLHAAGITHV